MEEKGNHKTMFLIIIALLVVLIAAIAIAVVLILGSTKSAIQDATGGSAPAAAQQAVTLTPADISPVNLTDPISTNLLKSPDGSSHVIRLSVGVGVNTLDKKGSAALITLLTDKEVIWRDVVIGLVRDKTMEELAAVDGRDNLKQEIKDQLSQLYDTNLIVEVYVSDMIFQ